MHLSVMLISRRYSQAHPRMNAALESGDFPLLQRGTGAPACGNEEVIGSGWLRDQVAIHDLGAFRRWGGITRCPIQSVYKAASEPLHARESMGFASQTLHIQGRSFGRLELIWRESPCARRLVHGDLPYETSEGYRASAGIADAGSGPEDRIKARGVAVVSQVNGERPPWPLGKSRDEIERQKKTAHEQNRYSHFSHTLYLSLN
jgi:hypothetical protein